MMRSIPSILVIDDNPEALDTIGQILKAIGAEHVNEVMSAEEGLELLNARSFSLIVADYRLKGMSGVEFLEQLRSRGDQTPLLLISGSPDKSGLLRAGRQPNVDFFRKPFQLGELLGAIDRLVPFAKA
jgi:CheY-like chemotaxis protein